MLAAFLLLYGATIIFGAAIPPWVSGVLALAAGILLLIEPHFPWRKTST